MRQEVDFSIIEELKTYILSFMKLYATNEEYEILRDRLTQISHLYIDPNITNQMASPEDYIEVHEKFVELDENGNFICFKKDMLELIFTQLIHEINHSISRNNKYHGISIINGGEKYYERKNFFLNEGLTQLFAEKITNISLDKNAQPYQKAVNIAKILDISIDSKIMFNSYYFNSDKLESEYNRISGDSNSYEKLNTSLNKLQYIQQNFRKKDVEYIYENLSKNIYRQITIDIIIPKIITMSSEQRGMYLSKLNSILVHDREAYKFIINYIAKIENFNSLSKENDEINKKYINIKNNLRIKKKLKQSDDLKSFTIDSNGVVKYIYQKNGKNYEFIVTDPDIISNIYLLQYTKNINEKELLNQILANRKIIFETDDIIEKRAYLEKVREVLSKLNYLLLNSIDEVSQNNYLELDIIISNKFHKIEYGDFKNIFNKYKINEKGIVVNKDIIPNKEVSDLFLVLCVKFIHLFNELANQISIDKKNKIYNQLEESYRFGGKLDLSYIDDVKIRYIVSQFLSNSYNYEIFNDFFIKNSQEKVISKKITYKTETYCGFYDFVDTKKNIKRLQ